MRYLTLLLLTLLLLTLPALADQAEDIALAVHPQHVISQRLDANGTTLLVLTQGQQHTLMLIEGRVITVDNQSALLPGDVLPGWSFSGDAAAWSYQLGGELVRYHAEKQQGEWGPVDVTVTGGESARVMYVSGGCLRQYTLKNGVRSELTPVAAPWLTGCISLPNFLADAMPLDLDTLPAEAFQAAADQLADGMTVLCGRTTPTGLLLLCDKPNHVSRIVAACVWDEARQGYSVTLSTAITQDCTAVPTENGLALVIGGCIYDIALTTDGGWGITGMHFRDGDIQLNAQYLMNAASSLQHALWGSNPWSSIAQMDWLSLPRSCTEAMGGMNLTGWAMVSNPNEADTLHLRQYPDAKAYSLGRYYNGAPMRVISSSKDWLQVEIGGVTGWMMKSYVAQDYAMQQVSSSLPMKHVVSPDGSAVPLYCQQHEGETAAQLMPGECVLVLGFCTDKWYHVLAPDCWCYGYVAMEAVK